MKHIHYYIYALLFAATLAACSNDDFNDKLTTSDEVNGPITFSASAQTYAPTRAISDGYRPWTTTDPQSMGVFGFFNLNKANFDKQNGTTAADQFFKNTQVSYAETPVSPFTGKWSYASPKYWPDYTWCNSYDFFAYMPYKEGTTIASTDGTNFTVTIPGVTLSQAVQTDIDNSPLICNLPVNKTVSGEVIEYKMDQTLAAFQIRFKLGQDMENVRDIFIKGVKIKGDLHKGGKIIRTYTWNNAESKWTSGKIEWKDLDTKTSANTDIDFANLDKDSKASYYDTENRKLHIISTDSLSWGKPFKVIPNDFTPNIEVTYDVTTNKVDNSTLTRYDVKSEIKFSRDFFKTYTEAAQTGKINPILINIVPSYLYVLADDDQKGYLIVNQTAAP